jgi:hypothetical protein
LDEKEKLNEKWPISVRKFVVYTAHIMLLEQLKNSDQVTDEGRKI